MKLPRVVGVLLLIIVVVGAVVWAIRNVFTSPLPAQNSSNAPGTAEERWKAPDSNSIGSQPNADLIAYGRALIVNTAFYLGPKGKVAYMSNGMNCQNCHLEAGTKFWGNNYSAVHSTYPRYRDRSGTVENIYKRINDCVERSLNGKALDSNGREMQAIAAYINWVGKDVNKGVKPKGAGITDIDFIDRPASPENGNKIFHVKCVVCHRPDGQGVMNPDGITYQYPPLWGPNSYNTGAGLYRISRFAGYIKNNMPFGVHSDSTVLTDEECWDLAAFINSQPRPVFERQKKDWPDISKKPIDHPFGPFNDGFTEAQHKYGPFPPIKSKRESQVKK